MKKRIIATVISALMLMNVTVQAYEFECYDTTKRSVSEAADELGLSFEEYKEYMFLDEAVPEWEAEHTAELKTRVVPVIEAINMTVDEFKEGYGLTIDITDDTIMCEVYDNMSLSHCWGDSYAEAVEYYGVADFVTPETLYGTIRLDIEKKEMDAVDRTVFSDVGYSHWARYYINEMLEGKIIDGYNDGTFLPEKNVTRAEFAKIFASCANLVTEDYENKYSDVSTDLWYAPYVNAVSEYIDTENGEFMPDLSATREVVATAISKYLGISDKASSDLLEERFTDDDTVSEKNAVYVADAVEKGIIDGFEDNTIRGGDSLTRAQAAAVIYRAFYEYYEAAAVNSTVVAKVGDIEITLGDALYTTGFDEDADLSDREVLTQQITYVAQNTAKAFAYTVIAKEDGITFANADRRNILAYRASLSSGIGYRKYCTHLKSSGTSIEYINRYVENLAYGELILEKYGEDETLERISKIEITIYEDAIKGIEL